MSVRRQVASTRTFASIFGAVGLLLLVIAAFLTDGTRRFIAESSQASGTVVRLDARTSTDRDGRTSTVYHPVVRFRTSAGEQVVFRSATGTSPPENVAGDSVRVLYHPARPGEARIDSFWSLWLGTVILSVLGVAFSGVAFFVYRLEPTSYTGTVGRRRIRR